MPHSALNTPALVATCCNDEREVVALIVDAANLAAQPPNTHLRAKSITIQLWKLCRGNGASEPSEVTFSGETNIKSQRVKLLETFRERHGFLPSLENQPSENTLALLTKIHKERSTEFFPLSRVTNYSEGRDLKIEPQKIKGAPFSWRQARLWFRRK